MMHTPINIPRLRRSEAFQVNINEKGGIVVTSAISGEPNDHLGAALVFVIDPQTPEGVADKLRMLLNDVLKAGFEQGREHVREALGIVK